MMTTFVKVKVEKDGTVHIPATVLHELGVQPPGELELMVTIPTVNKPKTPITLTEEDRARLKRIGNLIEESFAGMN